LLLKEKPVSKTAMGPQTLIYPSPALLIGANVENKPNFMTAAMGGIANSDPPMVSVSIRHNRHTLVGIRENMAFSVNIPSVDMVKETDYCGSVSGRKIDKVASCGFKVFYGKLASAPLIEQCPINLECMVLHLLDLGSHVLVIGRVEETHVSQDCLTDGKLDVDKVRPFCYMIAPSRDYRSLGDVIAKSYTKQARS
jgi:flavin reductase (DIM6/NTAB) family NADH-FMN oxidoreductase RutF